MPTEDTKLTNKQQAFVNEYVIDFNGTKAAIKAGYSKKTATEMASENLTKLNIIAAIKAKQAIAAEKAEFNKEDVLKGLIDIADHNRNKDDLKRMYNPQVATRALELLGKHYGMFADKLNIDGSISVNILSFSDSIKKTQT